MFVDRSETTCREAPRGLWRRSAPLWVTVRRRQAPILIPMQITASTLHQNSLCKVHYGKATNLGFYESQ